jgi:hypothetical protein
MVKESGLLTHGFLSDDNFQHPGGGSAQPQGRLPSVWAVDSDNQPCFLQNTPGLRYTSEVVGLFCLYFVLSTLHFVLVWQHFPSFAAALPTSATNRRICRRNVLSLLGTHHFLLSTVFFPLPQQFPLNCCCATPRRSNYACLLRQIVLFRPFPAVVKSPVARWRYLCSTPPPMATTSRIYCIAFAFTHYLSLITSLSFTWNCLLPTVWRDWRLYATKTPYPPQNRHILPV